MTQSKPQIVPSEYNPVIKIIMALGPNFEFGFCKPEEHNNKLPWHCSEDLQSFKRRTTRHILIMGTGTHASLPRDLNSEDRVVMVIGKSISGSRGVRSFASIEECFGNIAKSQYYRDKPIAVIGGKAIITSFMKNSEYRELVSEIYISRIKSRVMAQATDLIFFPEIYDMMKSSDVSTKHFVKTSEYESDIRIVEGWTKKT